MFSPHLVAGTAAGVITALLLQPLDLIKVRFQVQDGVAVPMRYRGVVQAAGHIWRSEGPAGFYRGVVPAAWGSGASWGLYFFFYEGCKRRLARSPAGEGEQRLSTWQHMYAAWEAGTLTCLLTNPIWLVKTRLQLQTAAIGTRDARNYGGMVDALGSIAREEGLRGLYRGLAPALLLTSHGMVQVCACVGTWAGWQVTGGLRACVDCSYLWRGGGAVIRRCSMAEAMFLESRLVAAPAYFV